MDLGISGKWAIVCASSKGLGRGCAEALADAGVNIVMCARGAEALETAAAAISSSTIAEVRHIVADVTTEEGRSRLLSLCGQPDILVTNAGGPPPGLWSDWNREDFIAALDANMLAPIDLMKRTLPGMIERGWGRVVNITSMSVRSPIGVLGLSNSARSGLTGYVAGTARQVAPFGVTINNLLPGIHDTDRATSLDAQAAVSEGKTPAEIRSNREAGVPAKRYGTAAEFGAVCAFLCSAHAGYIVGQNLLHDGGSVNLTT
ncbi:MAG: SDR family oxidoreductase [Rhodobacteraceae bacterium]|nr:SDR family oxidoreductase [Paracoccaceae bacterium]